MASATTYRRHARQAARATDLEQRAEENANAAEHYTGQDRATAEALEASDMLREFLATEI